MKRALRVGVLLGLLLGSAGCTSGSADIGRGDRPVPPIVGDDGSDEGELVFRIADFGFVGPTVSQAGRNLDGFNTAPAHPDRQCTAPSGDVTQVDGEGGIDNMWGRVGTIIDLVVPCAQTALEEEHSAGRGTLLVRIEGWNGEANDSVVTASLVVAADGTSSDKSDVEWNATTHELVLVSDGTTPASDPTGASGDTYVARPDSFDAAGTTPQVIDTDAYIADGTLVFALPERARIPLNAGGASLLLELTDGLLLADLASDFSSISSGTLSGRYSVAAFLDAAPGIGVCASELAAVENQVETLADVLSDPTAEGGPDEACNALSVGFPFTGAPATLATNGGSPELAGTNPPLVIACDTGLGCQ